MQQHNMDLNQLDKEHVIRFEALLNDMIKWATKNTEPETMERSMALNTIQDYLDNATQEMCANHSKICQITT